MACGELLGCELRCCAVTPRIHCNAAPAEVLHIVKPRGFPHHGRFRKSHGASHTRAHTKVRCAGERDAPDARKGRGHSQSSVARVLPLPAFFPPHREPLVAITRPAGLHARDAMASESSTAYLAKHDLEQKIAAAVSAALKARPDNPLAFIGA